MSDSHRLPDKLALVLRPDDLGAVRKTGSPGTSSSITAPVTKPRYPTPAKIDMAVAAARRAGIEEIGAIEIRADGTIRVSRFCGRAPGETVESEIEEWRSRRAGRSSS